ncbi:MAG: hypothetical protein EZS28_004069 [Streblomastix strix]|uniref:Uncharacterized protein n=1 Tax=Streblomastix strix TaxID=222440 RepID=A0A5J4X0X3_9EUKA|nr:MAG: hypothetical protein EZS28_004069 [Streblomastix strix]
MQKCSKKVWKVINLENRNGRLEMAVASFEYALLIVVNMIVGIYLDSYMGRRESSYFGMKFTIDMLIMFFDSFITTFSTTTVGHALGGSGIQKARKVLLFECAFAILFGFLLSIIFIPIRVPVLRLFGMDESRIVESKYYYIIEFCLCPISVLYATINSAFSAFWWFGTMFILQLAYSAIQLGSMEIFVVWKNMGITGVALTTAVPVISVEVGVAIIFLFASSVIGSIERMMVNSLALRAPSPSATLGQSQQIALSVVSDITSIPSMIAGIVGTICIAITSGSLGIKPDEAEKDNKKKDQRRKLSINTENAQNNYFENEEEENIISDYINDEEYLMKKKKNKNAVQMYIFVIAMCLLVALIFTIITLIAGFGKFVSRFVTKEDYDAIYKLVQPLYPLAILEIFLQSINGACKASTISNQSFFFYCMSEVIGAMLLFPVALIGFYTKFGSSKLPECFFLLLGNELRFLVLVVMNGGLLIRTSLQKLRR